MSRNVPRPGNKAPLNKSGPPPPPSADTWVASDFVSSSVSLEEVNQIKMAFDVFDMDSSGLIDPNELVNAFVSLGFEMNNKQALTNLKDLITEYPTGLDFGVFLNMATGRLGETHTRRQIDRVFNNFDNTRAGRITAQQFKQVAQELGEYLTEDEVERIFAKTDLDGDGFVTADDFYNIMTNNKFS